MPTTPRNGLRIAPGDVRALLAAISACGCSLAVAPSGVPFADETDRKFYDIAKAAGAALITGNVRHYPGDPLVTAPAAFLARYAASLR